MSEEATATATPPPIDPAELAALRELREVVTVYLRACGAGSEIEDQYREFARLKAFVAAMGTATSTLPTPSP